MMIYNQGKRVIFNHCTENHILFFQTSWKDGLSKKFPLEYDLSWIIGKDNISFSWRYDLATWTENERWSLSKNTRKYDIFFRLSEKMAFPKGPPWHNIFLVLSGKMVFFPENIIFFPREESERWPFLGDTWKQTWRHTPLSKKNQRWSYPAKIHLKVIDVLDWHPRKSSSNSVYFHGDLYERFHALLSSEEKQET